eukprot:CAMPEP_0176353266 /NCGR_PEP_ID=MMETSP0126-20121128/11654_1 /TAXON_ID=141414 ORGANISM="Strombidinopsis acuminatum, Strain SPMC142" /NCGR_SAMPLE_ID=MMETSP0126 /ASSEMBLY_ACC=CAM_ASM_000229 /LENGTH=64 /DNA_ID=CAMNT_0017704807 /DNA_START=728 /DNA_END=922 /DNA_ORIENTATION=-
MKVGSEVKVIDGTHRGHYGKVIAMQDPKAAMKNQKRVMGEKVDDDELDPDAYVSIELKINGKVV